MPVKRTTPTGAFKCIQGFLAATKNGTLRVSAGSLVPFDHPHEVMKGREHMFVDISEARQSGGAKVEQASAAPGEKRDA